MPVADRFKDISAALSGGIAPFEDPAQVELLCSFGLWRALEICKS